MKLEIAEGCPTNNAEIDRAGRHVDGNGQLDSSRDIYSKPEICDDAQTWIVWNK
jgi:hypothetical protein